MFSGLLEAQPRASTMLEHGQSKELGSVSDVRQAVSFNTNPKLQS